MKLNELMSNWHSVFGSELPDVMVRSPGRVNIIGEHTDYNEGWVMPGAMDHSLFILVRRNGKSNHWIATDLKEEVKFDHPNELNASLPIWPKYIQGAIHVFEGSLGPLQILIGGDLPIGAGVSSSSSLVCGLLLAFHHMSGDGRSKKDLAQLSSRVEREIIGLQGGIMDQYAIMMSEQDKLMLLDCREKTFEFIPAAIPGTRWVLINTKVKHQLIDSDYNQRASQCTQAVILLKQHFPNIRSLRDVNLNMLDDARLPEVLYRRSRFIVEENNRVHQMKAALQKMDANAAGKLLQASHNGLQYEYEVSCDESDHLAGIANHTYGVYGGRMMGGGFGGCVICLVEENSMDQFVSDSIQSYLTKFGFEPEVIHFALSHGTEVIS